MNGRFSQDPKSPFWYPVVQTEVDRDEANGWVELTEEVEEVLREMDKDGEDKYG